MFNNIGVTLLFIEHTLPLKRLKDSKVFAITFKKIYITNGNICTIYYFSATSTRNY